jgi:hypothetical protein
MVNELTRREQIELRMSLGQQTRSLYTPRDQALGQQTRSLYTPRDQALGQQTRSLYTPRDQGWNLMFSLFGNKTVVGSGSTFPSLVSMIT